MAWQARSASSIVRLGARAAAVTAVAVATAAGSGATATSAARSAPAAPVRRAPMASAAPVPRNPVLQSVSCPTVSTCMAVGASSGGPVAAIWNGTAWRWLAQPLQRKPFSAFDAVSCLSATKCMVLGSVGVRGDPFGAEWNRGRWRMLPPMARRFTFPDGLSCVSAAYCLAVAGGDAAELWTGTRWKRLIPVLPAGAAIIPFSVACQSRTNCMVTGEDDRGTGRALAVKWNGTSWKATTPPAGTFQFQGVSCPLPNRCLAVGNTVGNDGNTQPASALWNGSTWRSLAAPSPGGTSPQLLGVSCPTATRCFAVGQSFEIPFAESWSGGTSWKVLAISHNLGQLAGLVSVSCSRVSNCLAVGNPLFAESDNINGNGAIAWNGSTWRPIRENKVDSLIGVSCSSGSACLAVGGFLNFYDETAALAQSWHGRAWRLVNPPGGVLGRLSGASCVSRSFCMAVGATSLIWNGVSWKPAGVAPGTAGFGVVSCVSARFCMATASGSSAPLLWRGKTWTVVPLTFPSGSTSEALVGLSCTSQTFCVAVGDFTLADDESDNTTLAYVWNGVNWHRVATPQPAFASAFSAISCVLGSGCMAVGTTFNGLVGHDMAMRFKAGKWRVITMPGSTGIGSGLIIEANGPSSVSCASASNCMAVGSFAGTELAERWNGSKWRLTKPAGPRTGLIAVSCPKPSFCLAVGHDANLQLIERWNGIRWRLLSESNR